LELGDLLLFGLFFIEQEIKETHSSTSLHPRSA
jgi:hypothetical protein